VFETIQSSTRPERRKGEVTSWSWHLIVNGGLYAHVQLRASCVVSLSGTAMISEGASYEMRCAGPSIRPVRTTVRQLSENNLRPGNHVTGKPGRIPSPQRAFALWLSSHPTDRLAPFPRGALFYVCLRHDTSCIYSHNLFHLGKWSNTHCLSASVADSFLTSSQ
jgi:hypothetical protein